MVCGVPPLGIGHGAFQHHRGPLLCALLRRLCRGRGALSPLRGGGGHGAARAVAGDARPWVPRGGSLCRRLAQRPAGGSGPHGGVPLARAPSSLPTVRPPGHARMAGGDPLAAVLFRPAAAGRGVQLDPQAWAFAALRGVGFGHRGLFGVCDGLARVGLGGRGAAGGLRCRWPENARADAGDRPSGRGEPDFLRGGVDRITARQQHLPRPLSVPSFPRLDAGDCLRRRLPRRPSLAAGAKRPGGGAGEGLRLRRRRLVGAADRPCHGGRADDVCRHEDAPTAEGKRHSSGGPASDPRASWCPVRDDERLAPLRNRLVSKAHRRGGDAARQPVPPAADRCSDR